MTDPGPPVPPDPDARIDRGLRAAYGGQQGPGRGRQGAGSILKVLELEHGIVSRVTLAAGEDDEPMLRPAGEDLRQRFRHQDHYEVLGEIAAGGVGVILRGHDRDLGRDVAMKVLHAKYAQNTSIIQRFVEEAQIGGQLQHPGIVPVYEIGLQDDKRPYFTMKLVKGRTLALMLGERAEPSSDRQRFLAILLQVCQTMAYAHSRGVIHRDLKPANVMIGRYGEVKVVDWGFAKVLGHGGKADEARVSAMRAPVSIIETVRTQDDGTASIAGSVMGTPAYMPPEQAAGQVDLLDERSDVFALGAMLCEVLTGDPPFVGTRDEVSYQSLHGDLTGATDRLQASGADEELLQLALSCLAPERMRRPTDAGEVAVRLQGYLTSVEERARLAEIGAIEARVQAAGERKARRLTLALGAAVVVSLAVGTIAWLLVDSSRRDARARSQAAVDTALGTSAELLRQAEQSPRRASLLERARDACGIALESVRSQDPDFEVAQLVNRRADIVRLLVELEEDNELVRALAEAPSVELALQRASIIERKYARALAGYGLSESMSDEEIVARVRGRRVVVALARGLDSWGMIRLRTPSLRERAPRLFRLAARLDTPDSKRHEIRTILPRLATEDDETRAAVCKLLFDRAHDFAETSPENGLLLGEALFNGGAHARAVDVYRWSSRQYPDDFLLHLNLALLLERSLPPDLAGAGDEYRQAHALRPGDPVALVGLARVARLTGDKESWAHRVEAARRRAGDLPQTWIGLADEFLRGGQLADAIAATDRAVECAPNDAFVGVIRANQYLGAGVPLRRVLQELDRVDAMEPDLALSRAVRAQVKLTSGEFGEARRLLEKTMQLDPDDSTSLVNLGMLAAAELDFEAAKRAYRSAARRFPELGYMSGLAFVLLIEGELDQAELAAREGLRTLPMAGQNSLAWVLQFRHEYGAALKLWDKLVAANPVGTDDLARAMPALTRSLLANQQRLDELLASGRPGDTAHENLLLACHAQFAQRFATAAGAYQRAFDADPEIPKQNPVYLTQAASCILRAHWPNCADRNVTPPSWDVALGWMRAALQRSARLLDEGDRAQQQRVGYQLVDTMLNPIFASARDPHLGKQPTERQQSWRAYWSELRALTRRALDPDPK